jgi:hypothetical protein
MAPIPASLGRFDVVVSALAIHHLPDRRKRELFGEVFALLSEGGVFYDLELRSLAHPGAARAQPVRLWPLRPRWRSSDEQAALPDQLAWLNEAGFDQVDCYWKWMDSHSLAEGDLACSDQLHNLESLAAAGSLTGRIGCALQEAVYAGGHGRTI